MAKLLYIFLNIPQHATHTHTHTHTRRQLSLEHATNICRTEQIIKSLLNHQ